MSAIRVLVVEDEELIAEAHRVYTERVPGFRVVGVARTAREAMAALRRTGDDAVDLVLLDFNLPDLHGLEMCRAVRAAGSTVDVLAVTSARDLAMVRAAVALGVTHYLLKPFTFAAFRDRLERYATYRTQTSTGGAVAAQHEVDRMFATLRGTPVDTLPKGLGAQTLDAVLEALRGRPGQSASEISLRTGLSRVTARRYLEYLVDTGRAVRSSRYGTPGRPEVEYRPS
ncbi:response regulator [Micromonospora echinofusca]|uniref:Transcriptional regulatory protein n=1 Tax=Micromonospora echinofusca TaxID=47858 RepID=A0ABS3VM22_MICEH|nr:response regulator [Micromonospora echinofusca]MBO4205568.1 response regulator [Micromonospora echinofusca]